MKRDEALKQVERGLEELNEALAAGQSERLTRYLEVMAKFHRYSFGNVMLILTQRPDATQVAGFHRWKELGRHVKKGASGIGILAPLVYKKQDEDAGDDEKVVRGFKIVHVFDVSDTDGEELPEFATVEGEPGDNLARIEQLIRDSHVELLYKPLPLGTLGRCAEGTITISPDISDA
jgi:antirestriction protein ArdC